MSLVCYVPWTYLINDIDQSLKYTSDSKKLLMLQFSIILLYISPL